MEARVVVDGAKQFVKFAVRTVIFPLAWIWALAIAKRHEDVDPRARQKVMAGIAVGVVLAAGVGFFLYDFQLDARASMYDALDGRISVAVGESAYQDQQTTIEAADVSIGILQQRIAEAEAAGETENATAFKETLAEVQAARSEALDNVAKLEASHALYMRVSPVIQAQNDAEAKRILAQASVSDDVDSSIWDKSKMDGRSERAFEIKDKAVADMQQVMVYLLYPGVIGVFFAPMVIALGSVLGRAFERSDGVGYKKYPGGALGLFLLMGAFGWPSILFAAWGFWDMDVRSTEGQFAL